MAEINQAIVIKKITIEEGGGHGGAWKVAYADFVTAMMAFFLLLWLLSSASEEVKEGLADYFAPTIGVQDSQGIGFDGGTTISPDGSQTNEFTPPGVVIGAVPTGPIADVPEKKAMIEDTEEAALFEKARKEIKQAFESDPSLRDLADNIIVEQRPEGLKIEVMDSERESMFLSGSEDLSEYGKQVLTRMALVIQRMPNHISITGHTDESPYHRNDDVGNWELSSARANSARRYLRSLGMEHERVGKIVGKSSQELLVPEVPDSPRNRRITIILLRGSHMVVPMRNLPAPRDLLSAPRPSNDVPDAYEGASDEEDEQDHAEPTETHKAATGDVTRANSMDLSPAQVIDPQFMPQEGELPLPEYEQPSVPVPAAEPAEVEEGDADAEEGSAH